MFRRLHPTLLAFGERQVDRDSAYDAVSQTLMEFWLRWPQLTEEQRSDKYIFGAVRHRVHDEHERNTVFVSLDEVESELDHKVVAEQARAWGDDPRGKVIDRALASMPPRRRSIFLMVKEQGCSYADVAAVLGLSVATVNVQIVNANLHIHAALARAGIALPSTERPRLPQPDGGSTHD